MEHVIRSLRATANSDRAIARSRLASVYQPVVSLSHRRIVGHEALVRATDPAGRPATPHHLFGQVAGVIERARFDWRCLRQHLQDFARNPPSKHWLFVNLEPATIEWLPDLPDRLAETFARLALPPSRVVVELVEQSGTGTVLERTVAAVRALGCLIAVDDFGAGHSNFDRIWKLAPDIVKMDRALVAGAARKPTIRRVFAGMVDLLHEAGALVLAEGIETDDEALGALDAGVDLAQGYFFGRASASVLTDGCAPGDLCALARHRHMAEILSRRRRLAPYVNAFEQAACLLTSDLNVAEVSRRLMSLPGVRRCYVLDEDGAQQHLCAEAGDTDPRFEPLADGHGATWSRRSYFRAAVARPGELHISRPYLSITGMHLCITLSKALTTEIGTHVLCCDLDADVLDASGSGALATPGGTSV